MEGTNVRPDDALPENQVSETDIEMQMTATMKAAEGMVLVISSAQNIDRLVTIYRAAKRSGRQLVMDLYGASIAAATGYQTIPHPGPDWPNVLVYVPVWQRVKVKTAAAFERVERIKPHRVYEPYLAESRERIVLMFSAQSGPNLAASGCLGGASAIWSLWSGYLKEESGKRTSSFLAGHDIPLVQQHTSGHASVADLQRLASAIHAKKLVPIHSFGAHRFDSLFDHVTAEPDGAWWEV